MSRVRAVFIVAAAIVLTSAVASAAEVYDPPVGAGRFILTPAEPAAPRINGPAVFGVRPGAPFLYTVPVSGERPVRCSAAGLPAGLQIDAGTGRITGTIEAKQAARYEVKLAAENSRGRAEKPLTIVVGDTICLTPPLGWNSWNAWGHQVSQANVLASARAMVDKGLGRYGWTYINIDDTWQGTRGGPFNAIQGNEKFPDMKKLCDDVHALGLKVGIYSTPWITSYAGFVGGSSDRADGRWTKGGQALPSASKKKGAKNTEHRVGKIPFDQNDARQWAAWEIDYLKYDWNPNEPASTMRMAEALAGCGRDIVYSLSNTAPIKNAQVIAQCCNCWRTTGDLKDRWSEKGPCKSLVENWDGHRTWLEKGSRGGPGHFPDADMLVVGDVVEKNNVEAPRPSRLTADEQYTHISLWSLWSCPLLIGCPIERMDEFTVKLLTNPEVLDIQQDAKGLAGRTVLNEGGIEIIVKELADGSVALGLFNRNAEAKVVTADWKTVGLSGPRRMRDVWRNSDIGVADGSFSAKVRPHGVVLVRAMAVGKD